MYGRKLWMMLGGGAILTAVVVAEHGFGQPSAVPPLRPPVTAPSSPGAPTLPVPPLSSQAPTTLPPSLPPVPAPLAAVGAPAARWFSISVCRRSR